MSKIAITKSGTSVTINGSSYNTSKLSAAVIGDSIRVAHDRQVILDKAIWSDISYAGTPLADANALATLATNLTS